MVQQRYFQPIRLGLSAKNWAQLGSSDFWCFTTKLSGIDGFHLMYPVQKCLVISLSWGSWCQFLATVGFFLFSILYQVLIYCWGKRFICIPNSQMFNTPMSEYQNAKTQIFKYLSTIVTHIYIASRWHYNKNKWAFYCLCIYLVCCSTPRHCLLARGTLNKCL